MVEKVREHPFMCDVDRGCAGNPYFNIMARRREAQLMDENPDLYHRIHVKPAEEAELKKLGQFDLKTILSIRRVKAKDIDDIDENAYEMFEMKFTDHTTAFIKMLNSDRGALEIDME